MQDSEEGLGKSLTLFNPQNQPVETSFTWTVFDSVLSHCTNVKNEFFCLLGTCSVIGDPHVTTFDGKTYTMHLKECSYVMSEQCHMPNGVSRGYSITIRNRNCTAMYANCKREVLVNVTGQPFLILDVEDGTSKPTASIETQSGSVTSVKTDYSAEKMDVEFLGDRNIFVRVNLGVGIDELGFRKQAKVLNLSKLLEENVRVSMISFGHGS